MFRQMYSRGYHFVLISKTCAYFYKHGLRKFLICLFLGARKPRAGAIAHAKRFWDENRNVGH